MFLHKRLHMYLLWATAIFAILAILSALITDSEGGSEVAETTTTEASTTTTTVVLDSKRTHVVKAGDNLYQIAKDYNLSAPALIELNNLDKEEPLNIGQVLRLPPSLGFVPIGGTTTMPP